MGLTLSVVIPAFNESGSIKQTVFNLYARLKQENIPHQILVVNGNSTDDTLHILEEIRAEMPTLEVITSTYPNGFGYTVLKGLENYTGELVAIMMADLSDSPDDLVKFYHKIHEGYDCVFGSRWIKGAVVTDYPLQKYVLNRLFNYIVKLTFWIKCNDITNAFKLYRRETMEGLKPFLSNQFNLTLELPLKAVIRGYSYAVVPNSWTNRTSGKSKLRVLKSLKGYLYIFLCCFAEKYFKRKNYTS